jgi:hypothetical protein
MKILIKIPFKIWGVTFLTRQYRREIPEAWAHIPDISRRLFFLRHLALMPNFDTARLHILKSILNLPRWAFFNINRDDLAALLEQLEWLRPNPSTIPIIDNFKHQNTVFHLPKGEFTNGKAYEFAVADDYYTSFLESPNDPEPLLRLVATLARPERKKREDNIRYGDLRIPLFTEHEVEFRAKYLKDIDFAIVIAVLRYFEGVKKMVYDMGIDSGIFDPPNPKDEEAETQNPKSDALFGWWTAFRSIAKTQNKTEEQIWDMSLWRVISIMIEEKHKQDVMEKQMRATQKSV